MYTRQLLERDRLIGAMALLCTVLGTEAEGMGDTLRDEYRKRTANVPAGSVRTLDAVDEVLTLGDERLYLVGRQLEVADRLWSACVNLVTHMGGADESAVDRYLDELRAVQDEYGQVRYGEDG